MRWLIISLLAKGCGQVSGGDDAGHDAGVDPSCCRISGATMEMSWECYCAQFNCDVRPTSACGAGRTTTFGCGLRTDSFFDDVVSIDAFDDAGVLVGHRFAGAIDSYACPGAPEKRAFSVRAGVFADDACNQTSCECIDGGVVCP